MNGNPLVLQPSQSVSVAASAGPTLYEGDRYAFMFTIDSFDFPTEGEYSATITFTLVAQ
ncbi:MAG: hypothetical protein Kow009_11190 [Spirochaetales bacterium]